MPEMPEVECVRLSLEPKFVGKKIVKAEVFLDKIIKQQEASVFLKRAIRLKIKEANRRGKYLLFSLEKENEAERVIDDSSEYIMIIHLGMTGATFAINSLNDIIPEFKKHIHAVLTLDDGTLLAYCDIRRFGGLRIFTSEEFQNYDSIQKMGPEPSWEGAEDEFLKRIKKKTFKMKKQPDGSRVKEDIPIKEAILNQNNVAGIGNIYACESLLYAGILPTTPVSNLSDEQLRDIFKAAKTVMEFSITVGGSSISDYVDSNGKRGRMQEYLVAYGQEYCGLCETTKIVKTVVAGRGTFHCPNCQH